MVVNAKVGSVLRTVFPKCRNQIPLRSRTNGVQTDVLRARVPVATGMIAAATYRRTKARFEHRLLRLERKAGRSSTRWTHSQGVDRFPLLGKLILLV